MLRIVIASSLLVTTLASVGCHLPESSGGIPVWTQSLDAPRRARVHLRSRDVFLKSSNDLALPIAIPAGTLVKVEKYSAGQIDLRARQLVYTMYPLDGRFDTSEAGVRDLLNKYFLDSSDTLAASHGGDQVRIVPASYGPRVNDRAAAISELETHVEAGELVLGMTKEQCYETVGPPRYVGATELATLHLSIDRILASDFWVYHESTIVDLFPRKKTLRFVRDRLAAVE